VFLAANLRVVARTPDCSADSPGEMRCPPVAGLVILSRLMDREAAAAMALFGEEIDGDKAVGLGLAWESVDDAAVEDHALESAQPGAAAPELVRVAVGNFRKEVVGWDVAMQYERPAQMWSMRRSAD
jgi:enoyl-CoA hydratase/carnithine racemase